MNLEEYIKSLDPELQEKVRACGSAQELLALAKEAGIPVPEEVLANVTGGEDGDIPTAVCPRCGSTDTLPNEHPYYYLCLKCGYKFDPGW